MTRFRPLFLIFIFTAIAGCGGGTGSFSDAGDAAGPVTFASEPEEFEEPEDEFVESDVDVDWEGIGPLWFDEEADSLEPTPEDQRPEWAEDDVGETESETEDEFTDDEDEGEEENPDDPPPEPSYENPVMCPQGSSALRMEDTPFDFTDNDCDGKVDEPEFFYPIYDDLGEGFLLTNSSVPIRIIVKDRRVISAPQLSLLVEYSELSNSASSEYQIIDSVTVEGPEYIDSPTESLVASPFIVDVSLSGLRSQSVYRIKVRFISGGDLLGEESDYYYAVTADNSYPTKGVNTRTKVLMRGLKEVAESDWGRVGWNGTVDVDGTRYGADPEEWWCSEFYAWVAELMYPWISGAANTTRIIQRFEKYNSFVSFYGLIPDERMGYVRRAIRGDYLVYDWDWDELTDHSAMFLALDESGEFPVLWTLEGNLHNEVRIARRSMQNNNLAGLGGELKN